MDYQGLPAVDVLLPVTPDEAVPELNKALGFTAKPFTKRALPKRDKPDLSTGKMVVNDLVREFPMEYSVELKRLIDLEMEGSVG